MSSTETLVLRLALAGCFASVPLVASAAPEPASTARLLGLGECIELALRAHPDLRVTRIDLAKANAGIRFEQGAFDPNLRLSTRYSGVRTPTEVFDSEHANVAVVTAFRDELNLGMGVDGRLSPGTTYSMSAGVLRGSSNFASAAFDPRYDTFVSLGLSQPILRGAWEATNTALIIEAEHRADAARFHLEAVAADLVHRLTVAYWNLVATVDRHQIGLELVDLATTHHDLTAALMRAGKVTEADLIKTDASIAKRRQQVLVLERETLQAETQLLSFLIRALERSEVSREFRPSDRPRTLTDPADVEAAMATASEARWELGEVKAKIRDLETTVIVRRSATRPDLSFESQARLIGVGGAANPRWRGVPQPPELIGGLDRATRNLLDGNVSFDVGLVFSIPLDNSTAEAALEIAELDVARARAELDGVKDRVALEAREAVKRWDLERARLESAKTAARLASDSLAAEQQKYAAGVSTTFEILLVQEDYADARQKEAEAAVATMIAHSELQRATGVILSGHGIRLRERDDEWQK